MDFSPNMLAEYFSPENTNWFDGPEAMAIRDQSETGSVGWADH